MKIIDNAVVEVLMLLKKDNKFASFANISSKLVTRNLFN